MANPITLLHVAPLSIPDPPYTREELENYAGLYFNYKGHCAYHQGPVQQRILCFMERLPAWAQVLMVENRIIVDIGSRAATEIRRSAAAEATPHQYRFAILKSSLMSHNDDGEYYLGHELAHCFDALLARQTALRNDSGIMYQSENTPRWHIALQQDFHRRKGRSSADPAVQWKKFLESPTYKPADYSSETFAFLLSLLFLKHFRGEAEAKIGEDMRSSFPHLWPAFEEHIRPDMLSLASRQYHYRRESEEENLQTVIDKIASAANKVALRYGCEGLSTSQVRDLAQSHRVNWLHLLEGLSDPLPSRSQERLRLLFPDIFDPSYGAPLEGRRRQPYDLRTFPQLRVQVIYFAVHVDELLKNNGLSALITDYAALWDDFAEAIEAKQTRSVGR